jgi:hypothetical protein
MISDANIISAENLPDEIRMLGDRPWFFHGEIKLPEPPAYFDAVCRCQIQPLLWGPPKVPSFAAKFKTFVLNGWDFITDDMLIVKVYVGQCEECERVYWARSGPPYQRCRAFVPA